MRCIHSVVLLLLPNYSRRVRKAFVSRVFHPLIRARILGFLVVILVTLFFCSVEVDAGNEYRVGVIKPAESDPLKQLAEDLANRMNASTVSTELKTGCALLANEGQWLKKLNCLVLSPGAVVSKDAGKLLRRFIRNGGDLVFAGGRTLRMSGIRFPGAFPDYDVYDLGKIRQVKHRDDQSWFARSEQWTGDMRGRSAVAIELPHRSRFVPLLGAFDRYGRRQGWAGGVMVHYNGRFQGSQWALFGIFDRSFYEASKFGALLRRVVVRFAGGNLLDRAAKENRWSNDQTMDTSSEPLPPIELDREEGQFVTPDGERFLAMGTNMIAKGGFVQRWWGEFNTEVVKRSFKRMADAGLNTVRLFGFNQLEHLNVIREYARRYGIYVLVELGHEETRKKRIEKVREFASRYAGSNFVLGYDLRNEPYFWEVATIEEDGQRLHERYPETGPQDNWKHWNAYLDHAGFSTWFDKNVFSHIEGGMPKPANKKQRRAYEAVNGMLDRWIGWNERTIESSDPGRPMTVGYNTYLACLPANERLDFLAQHVYRPPHSFENVRANLTTMDRLADVWSGKPVSLGEFGLSNGGTLKNGKPIDVHSSAVGELMYYLYALAKGHMGVYKWQLFDFPVAAEKRLANWMRDAKRAKLRRQARFGMYYYDGTPDGAAKPIVHSLKFLRTYVNSGNKKGRIRLLKAPETTIKAGYRFRGEQALFVGHRRWKGKGLRFDTGDAIPTNLMVQWREDGVKLMSSRDVTVRLQPGHFVEGLTATNAELTGFYGSKRRKEKWLSVRLLSGETVTIGRW